jgi:hypothetical protein
MTTHIIRIHESCVLDGKVISNFFFKFIFQSNQSTVVRDKHITRFVTRVKRWVPLVEQELLPFQST